MRDLSCTVAGCLTAGARRIGWDLPAVQDEKRVTAGDLPAAASAPSVLSATLAPITELACKPALAPTAIAQIPGDEMMDNRSGDLRWASVRRSKDSEIAIIFGTRTAVRETVLLAALPKPKAADSRLLHTKIRSGARVLNDGVVAARYHAIKDNQGQPQSIDVDLAWWSASTGRTTRHTLTKQKPFYLSPDGDFSGTPQIVDGGLPLPGRGQHHVRSRRRPRRTALAAERRRRRERGAHRQAVGRRGLAERNGAAVLVARRGQALVAERLGARRDRLFRWSFSWTASRRSHFRR